MGYSPINLPIFHASILPIFSRLSPFHSSTHFYAGRCSVTLDKDDINAIADAVIQRLIAPPSDKANGKGLLPFNTFEFSEVMRKVGKTGNYKLIAEYAAKHSPPQEA
jgi:hypothetical protein